MWLLGGLGDAKNAAIIGAKIVDELSKAIFFEEHELDISCSVGISVYPDDGIDVNTLMMNADVAMYHAKKSGRNNFRFFTPGMNAVSSGVAP